MPAYGLIMSSDRAPLDPGFENAVITRASDGWLGSPIGATTAVFHRFSPIKRTGWYHVHPSGTRGDLYSWETRGANLKLFQKLNGVPSPLTNLGLFGVPSSEMAFST